MSRFVSCSGTPGGSVTCDIPYLAGNSSAIFVIEMTAVARGRHTNNISVTSDETALGYEAPTDNNVSYEDTTVRVKADLVVTKVPSVATIDLRKEFSWDITITNKAGPGLDVAEEVTLVDVLPDGMELTAPPTVNPSSAGTCTGASIFQPTPSFLSVVVSPLEACTVSAEI